MWRNYLAVGTRAFVKNKAYTFINIFGLAVGIAACLMILLYVRYEISYDAWIPEADRAYQVQSVATERETGGVAREQMSAFPVGISLAKDFAEIEEVSRAVPVGTTVLRDGTPFDADMLLVDDSFFRIFPLPFLRGDPAAALRDMNSVVLTKAETVRHFGTIDALGETFTIVRRGEKVDLRVTGVIEDLPRNTHLKLGLIGRFNPNVYAEYLDAWGLIGGYNYLKLKPGADAAAIHERLPAWERRNIPFDRIGGVRTSPGEFRDWYLTPITEVHLGEAQDSAMTPGNDWRTIITFVVIAVLILVMACVNFINLSTARATQRAQEVALRKVLGASRRQLVLQFLGESILLAVFAMLIALALVELTLPMFEAFLDAGLDLDYVGLDGVLLPALGLALLVGGVGGLYPAFYLSRFRPADVLKANRTTSDGAGPGRLRNALVVVQFAVSIGLIACTAVIYAQTQHVRTSDLGFRREGLLQIERVDDAAVRPLQQALVDEIARIEGVASASLTSTTIGDGGNIIGMDVQVPGREPIRMESHSTAPSLLDTMGSRLLAGRSFSERRPLDEATFPDEPDAAFERALVERGMNILVNELATKRLGFATPEAALGAQVGLPFVSEEHGLVPATIVGVFEDVRLRSAREPIQPTLFRWDRSSYDKIIVRYQGDPGAVRDRLQAIWNRRLPEMPFRAGFVDEAVGELYAADDKRALSFGGFATLAIAVACLGLFGLAAFTAEHRTKEIGIRKVFGATVRDIVRLLVWQFSKPVVIANLIAWPVAWWLMRDWLNNFDVRISLGPTPFMLAGLLAFLVAIGTVAGHAIRVARANPIHALRYE